MKEKNYPKAESLLLKAYARNPGDGNVSGALATLYAESGRPGLARRYGQQLEAPRVL